MNEQDRAEGQAAIYLLDAMTDARDKAIDDLVVEHLIWRRAFAVPGNKMAAVYEQHRTRALERLLAAECDRDEAVERWIEVRDRVLAECPSTADDLGVTKAHCAIQPKQDPRSNKTGRPAGKSE